MKEKERNIGMAVLDLIKKALIVLSVVANIVLGIMYARVEAQYTMYREFAPVDKTVAPVPNLPLIK